MLLARGEYGGDDGAIGLLRRAAAAASSDSASAGVSAVRQQVSSFAALDATSAAKRAGCLQPVETQLRSSLWTELFVVFLRHTIQRLASDSPKTTDQDEDQPHSLLRRLFSPDHIVCPRHPLARPAGRKRSPIADRAAQGGSAR